MHYFTKEIVSDSDSDDVDDDDDNCLLDANISQLDSDADGFGNACDPDYDDSGMITTGDLMPLRSHFGKAPGPSALACADTIPCAGPVP